jgi:hypothetical protein
VIGPGGGTRRLDVPIHLGRRLRHHRRATQHDRQSEPDTQPHYRPPEREHEP